ncbi:hypothetical protein B0T14DRAFT_83876 [Immersiella caudata]|uniref:Uncharacterized protein n=1 Tax=Immersiella caudata TaxID=314043 RepID=A0AA40CD86_9PEZI|nr:hypothetical protein B0T14DRAFT_83876 [Immersiella caudata]
MLYNTPWLPEYWSLDDVYMDRSDPTRLYRKQVFSKHSPVPSQPKPDDTDVIDNEPIFCLAVALLELTFGAPLTNFYNSNCGIAGPNTNSTGLGAADPVAGPDNRLLRLITAKRLTKAIRKHEEERFASVVIKCMNPPSSSPTEYDFSFQSEAFRKQFIQDVVVPLWRDVVSLRE